MPLNVFQCGLRELIVYIAQQHNILCIQCKLHRNIYVCVCVRVHAMHKMRSKTCSVNTKFVKTTSMRDSVLIATGHIDTYIETLRKQVKKNSL